MLVCLFTGVDKIIGFALSYHLKNYRTEVSAKDSILTLSSER